MSQDSPLGDSMTRQLSTSSRFEIKKVDETQKNKFKMNDENVNINPRSSLKKNVHRFEHDESFEESSRFIDTNINKGDLSQTGCFQLNYDEKNEPQSITCNLQSTAIKSYPNCFEDLKTPGPYQKSLAEFLGTLILTLYACSIGLPISEDQVPSLNGCLGGGLTLATLIWCMGNVSGGHFNPSVTIAFLLTGKINPLLTIIYIVSQLLGAYVGALILHGFVFNQSQNVSLIMGTVTTLHPDIHLVQGIAVEIIITFILVLTIFSCVDSSRKDLGGSFPLQIGFAVVIGGLFGGKFTGGSMNPARSFGPALVTGIWQNHWVYWLGPILGAILAGFIYQFVLNLKCPRKYMPRNVYRA